MLSTLHIENIAVIEQAEIAFDSGFNVLTGETGAGKSIVIDAISAILGERASREMIRTGAQKAFVSAIFSGVPELPWFVENHVPYEPELGISREIFADGKNSCRVSGKPVTVSTLRKLVDCGGGAVCKSGHGLDDDHVLCIVHAGNTLPEDQIQLGRESMFRRFGCSRIPINAVRPQFLDDAQLLDVPGNGCLRGIEAAFLQLLQQLFLRLDVVVADQLEDFFVAF